jgi:pimeloyl-ACP methyl ester carboxylesterase
MPRPRNALALVFTVIALGACGSDGDSSTAEPTRTERAPQEAATQRPPDGRFPVGADRHQLAIHCVGKGSPTIILEAGTDSSGIVQFGRLMDDLGRRASTCAYDRVGTGRSDPPSARRRTIDEVVSDLHGLIDSAKLPGPYLLVGQSGGGNIAIHYAGRHPERVAGVILIDVSAPTGDLGQEFPGPLGWKNPEHIDWVAADRLQKQHPLRIGDTPLVILTATDGQTSAKDQRFWLRLSSNGRQKTLQGGHDLHEENPGAVIAEIEATLATLRG